MSCSTSDRVVVLRFLSTKADLLCVWRDSSSAHICPICCISSEPQETFGKAPTFSPISSFHAAEQQNVIVFFTSLLSHFCPSSSSRIENGTFFMFLAFACFEFPPHLFFSLSSSSTFELTIYFLYVCVWRTLLLWEGLDCDWLFRTEGSSESWSSLNTWTVYL